MRDLYLEAKLKGIEVPRKREKGRFEVALDKSIRQYLDTLSFDEQPGELISAQEKKERFEAELRNSLTHSDLTQYLTTAIQVIRNEGSRYLDSQAHSALLQEFTQAEDLLKTLDLEKIPEENFGKILHLNEETIGRLFKIAVAKFQEKQFPDSLALFVLLTVLEPTEFDLWFRTGVVAQFCENYPLAINVYAIAASLNPELTEAYLFAAECYLKLGMLEEAQAEALKAEGLISDDKRDLLDYIKLLIK